MADETAAGMVADKKKLTPSFLGRSHRFACRCGSFRCYACVLSAPRTSALGVPSVPDRLVFTPMPFGHPRRCTSCVASRIGSGRSSCLLLSASALVVRFVSCCCFPVAAPCAAAFCFVVAASARCRSLLFRLVSGRPTSTWCVLLLLFVLKCHPRLTACPASPPPQCRRVACCPENHFVSSRSTDLPRPSPFFTSRRHLIHTRAPRCVSLRSGPERCDTDKILDDP